MALFEEVLIQGEPSEMAGFRDRLITIQVQGWRRDHEAEKRFLDMNAGPEGALSFIRERDDTLPSVALWILPRGPREYSLSNMIPMEKGVLLTPTQFGAILDDFGLRLLDPATETGSVHWYRRPESKRQEDILTRSAQGKFSSFVTSADRFNLDTLDWKRWSEFVIQVHRDDTAVDAEDVDRWLAAENWDDANRRRLVADFNIGMLLLVEYDRELAAR